MSAKGKSLRVTPVQPLFNSTNMILIVFFLAPVAAFLRPLHECHYFGETYLTDCCSQADVRYCTSTVCFTAVGCRVCVNGTCWAEAAPGVSVVPGSRPAWRDEVCAHMGLHGWVAWVTGSAGLGEVYGVTLSVLLAVESLAPGEYPLLTCYGECNWTLTSILPNLSLAADGVFEGVEWLVRLPGRLETFLSGLRVGVVLLLLLLCLEGRWPLAVALVWFNLTYCSGLDIFDQCTPKGCVSSPPGVPCLCPNGLWWGRPNCTRGRPGAGVTSYDPWHKCPSTVPTAGRLVCLTGGWEWIYESGKTLNHPYSSLCTSFAPNTRSTCPSYTCLYDVRPPVCRLHRCYNFDCERGLALGPSETCISGPRISAGILVTRFVPYTRLSVAVRQQWLKGTTHSILVAVTSLAAASGTPLPTVGKYKGVLWGAMLKNGSWPAGLWRPLPGVPLDCEDECSRLGSSLPVPKGYAWTGLATKAGSIVIRGPWQYAGPDFRTPVAFMADFWTLVVTLMLIARARIALWVVTAYYLWARGGFVLGAPQGFWVPVTEALPDERHYCEYVPQLDAFYCTQAPREVRAIQCGDPEANATGPTCPPWIRLFENASHQCYWLAFGNITQCYSEAGGELASGFSSIWSGLKHAFWGTLGAITLGGVKAANGVLWAANHTANAVGHALGVLGGLGSSLAVKDRKSVV